MNHDSGHSASDQAERLAYKSLDEIDREEFAPRFTPWDTEPEAVALDASPIAHPPGREVLSLDGSWQLAEGGKLADRLGGPWPDAIPANVPGSVHTALVAAGVIPDPTVGLNQAIAREESFKTWWMRCDFQRPASVKGDTLLFEGVANRCTVWLNGKLLGSHEGMFGGPDFDIAGLLQADNSLVVRLEPIPFESWHTGATNPNNNGSWMRTVVFNNVYGWHYSNLPSMGLWRSVSIRETPPGANRPSVCQDCRRS